MPYQVLSEAAMASNISFATAARIPRAMPFHFSIGSFEHSDAKQFF